MTKVSAAESSRRGTAILSRAFSQADWLDESRAVDYSRLLVCLYVLITAVWIGLGHNLIDPNGKPVGTDFMDVWTAGKMVRTGDPANAYDYNLHYEFQKTALPYRAGERPFFFGWHYPPMFFFAAVPLSLLPYGAALAAWILLTLPAYLGVMRPIIDHHRWLAMALAFPAVFINTLHGQNGFLTTALMGGGLLLLEKKPVLAGILFGCLCYKPQFGLLLPVVLLVGKQWRAFAAAAAATLFIVAASALAFGVGAWRAFFDTAHITRSFVLEQGSTGWEKIQSTFSAIRMLGGGVDTAYAVQGVVSIVAALAAIFVWRRTSTIRLKGGVLVTATILATPYVLDYDLILLALPIAWLAGEARATEFLPYEKIVLFAAYALPLLSRTIGAIGIPMAPFVLLALLALIVRRALAPDIKPLLSNPQPAAG